MKIRRAQLIVLVIALGAGVAAARLVAVSQRPPAPAPAPQTIVKNDTVEVLVANKDIGIGQALSGQNIAWQEWPAASAADYIKKTNRSGAIQELSGTRARTGFAAGEPIREARLVRAGRGFLSSILPKGMRGVAVEISPENGAGGFILPGDHVDVIFTRTPVGAKGEEGSSSSTILQNVRVLAIDHTVDENNNQNTAVGKIAMLELTSSQAQMLALARRLGTLSLVLRGLDDVAGISPEDAANLGGGQSVAVVRYGVVTNALH